MRDGGEGDASVASGGALPSKLYFRIGEVASLVGVEPHVLRYWEREFRTIRPTKSAKGQRVYSRRDVENLMRVRDLLYAEGFTIAGAKRKLSRAGAGAGAAAAAGAPSAAAAAASDRETDADVEADAGADADQGPAQARVPVAGERRAERHAEGQADRQIVGARAGDGDSEPPGAAASAAEAAKLRTALTELRAEIEAFLHEIT